jgi:hypothetical protein
MHLVSNLVRARYRNQVLFQPTSNGNSASIGRIKLTSRTTEETSAQAHSGGAPASVETNQSATF